MSGVNKIDQMIGIRFEEFRFRHDKKKMVSGGRVPRTIFLDS